MLRYLVFAALLAAPAFAQTPSFDVTLTWDAPTTNTDGSPLDDLAGYMIEWGPRGGPYLEGMLQLPDPDAITQVLTDQQLDYGREYCFVARAYNSTGVFSAYSNEACGDTPNQPSAPINLQLTIRFNAPT